MVKMVSARFSYPSSSHLISPSVGIRPAAVTHGCVRSKSRCTRSTKERKTQRKARSTYFHPVSTRVFIKMLLKLIHAHMQSLAGQMQYLLLVDSAP